MLKLLLGLCILIVIATFASGNPIIDGDDNEEDSHYIISGRKHGNYIDNITEMCERTKAKRRTYEELTACIMLDSVKNMPGYRKIDRFLLPQNWK